MTPLTQIRRTLLHWEDADELGVLHAISENQVRALEHKLNLAVEQIRHQELQWLDHNHTQQWFESLKARWQEEVEYHADNHSDSIPF